MTIRKKQTPAKKRARSQPVKRAASGRLAATARGRSAAATAAKSRGRKDKPLILAAECTVAEADSLKTQLARRLRQSPPVTVDVSALERIDTAGLQLLAAFVRDRRTAGRAVAWRGRSCALEAAAGILGLHDMLELPREAGR